MVDFEDLQGYIYRAIDTLKDLNKEIGKLNGAIQLGANSVSMKDLENLVRGLYYNYKDNPVAEEYVHLSNKIRNIIRNRLIEKHKKHKNTWKHANKKYLRNRVRFLYNLLLNDWNSKFYDEEPKRLLDIAIQCILLHLRLKEMK